MIVIGLALAGYGGYDYVQQSDAISNAVTVNATVTETGVDTVSQRRGGVEYKPTVTFTYRYEGESYTGTKVYPASVTPNYETKSKAQAVLDDYEINETVTAYVPRSSPGNAFLKENTSNAPLKFAGIGILIVLLSGAKFIRSG